MQTQTINDVQVVFRDTIPAKFGWKLIKPMNRLTAAFAAKAVELKKDDQKVEEVFIPGLDVTEIVNDTLGWDDVVLLVRGAVESWGFDGDLSTPKCCDNLDALSELFPIVTRARGVYHGVTLSGE